MRKIRLAVIGTGMAWDKLHLPAIQELSDKYQVVAMANLSEDELYKAADKIGLSHEHTYTDYHQMLRRHDIDAVNVAVPISKNYEISRDVVKARKHLICEKPLAPNMEQAIDFVKLQKEHRVKIMIGENFRYNEENNMIRDIIKRKDIGNVLYFIKNNIFNFEECMTGDSFAAKEWRQHPDFEGGMILDAGVHDIAELRYIFGDLTHVSAFGNPIGHDYAPYININCNLMFKSGVVGHYVYCSKGNEAQKPSIGLRIFGTEGMIYLEDKYCSVVNVFYNDGRHEMLAFTPQRGYYNEFVNFYEALVNHQKIQVTPMVEFGDTKLIFALLEAAKEKRVVSIDPSESFIKDKR